MMKEPKNPGGSERETRAMGGVGEQPKMYRDQNVQTDMDLKAGALKTIATSENPNERMQAAKFLQQHHEMTFIGPEDRDKAAELYKYQVEAYAAEKAEKNRQLREAGLPKIAQLRSEIAAVPTKESLKVREPVMLNIPAMTPELIERHKREEDEKKRKSGGWIGKLGAMFRGKS